jgi:hypothetical protein
MARKYAVSLDLNKNELLNARIQNLGSAPSNPVSGQIYYNNVTNVLYFYNGTEWTPTSGSTEVIQDVVGAFISGGTGLTSTYNDAANTLTIKLNDTAVTAGSYGSSTAIPTFTVDAQGRLTAAGTATVATNLSIAGKTGTDTVNLLTDTLTVTGVDSIDTAVTDNRITISAKDATSSQKGVASFDPTDFTVTSGAVTVNAERVQDIVGALVQSGTGITATYNDAGNTETINITNTGVSAGTYGAANKSLTLTVNAQGQLTAAAQQDISIPLSTQTTGDYVATIVGTTNQVTVSPNSGHNAAVTVGLPNDVTVNGTLTVGGDLNVTGKVNSVNTTTINIQDNKVNLNSTFTGTPVADAGIRVERGDSADVEVLWNETSKNWTLTNNGSNYHVIARKYATTIGDGAATSYEVTHNLGTKDVTVQIFENNADYNQIEADVQHTSDSVTTIKFASAPAAGEYRVVVVG